MSASLIPFFATAALLAATLGLDALTSRRVPEPLAAPLETIPARLDGWSAMGDRSLDESSLRALAPTAYLSRPYRKGQDVLDLFISFYAQQRAGESMHSPKHCLPGSGWEIWDHGGARLVLGGREVAINKYSIQNQGVRRLMLYWYQSRERIIASEYLGKILLAKDSVLGGHTAGSIVRLILDDKPGAGERGLEFAAAVIPEVQRCFGDLGRVESSPPVPLHDPPQRRQ